MNSYFERRNSRIIAERELTSRERRIADHRHLSLMTNLGLSNALIVGFIVLFCHGGMKTPAIAAYGAALGLGGVLGFLFGVPSASKGEVTNVRADTAAISTGDGSKSVSGDVSVSKSPPEQDAAKKMDGAPHAAPETTAASERREDPVTVTKHEAPPTEHTTSNLEQVADWVTKLLLGGGLTQMAHIPPKIWQWSHAVAMGILRWTSPVTQDVIVGEQSYAAGVMVYGFIVGFFSGFLLTRLQLGKAVRG